MIKHSLNFREAIKHIERELELVVRIDKLNSKLCKYNWVFVHPYSQGFEITFFEKLLENEDDNFIEEKIFERFAKKFLDLKLTITFIEGFYRKRPYLNTFKTQIEESVILCIQKDFSGAISLLLPVNEGVLRSYLISKRGENAKRIIKMSELSSKAFMEMSNEYEDKIKTSFSETDNVYFYDKNQQKQVLIKHREYFKLWIKQLNDYLNNNLYFDTRNSEILDDPFNRHNMVHAFEKIDYSFKNYLRLFNCVNYLSWAFGVISEKCSVFPEIDEKNINEKWVEYFKILIVSESITETKSKIHQYEIETFKKYIDEPYLNLLLISETLHKKLLKIK
ncbi:hypothetical protein [Winogradskyella sp. SYSU M77433]|uniref:hypothetical protein n=1 Tax=Winogradskyella sp. SYSU M77433 TaxID=3042722 RepID=UPI00248076D9|nr:hypothetical protein [Winogradskyella sp. SYSU M77433]MDH7913114.1 hypothetical protein [Winogradskyella sp. SYSU M77433]